MIPWFVLLGGCHHPKLLASPGIWYYCKVLSVPSPSRWKLTRSWHRILWQRGNLEGHRRLNGQAYPEHCGLVYNKVCPWYQSWTTAHCTTGLKRNAWKALWGPNDYSSTSIWSVFSVEEFLYQPLPDQCEVLERTYYYHALFPLRRTGSQKPHW